MTYEGPERRQRNRRKSRIIEVRPTYASVDVHALAQNLAAVKQHVGDRCRVLAVVKADGYGHGAVEASRELVEAGAWGLAVSLVEEGVELRQAGVHAPVLVLGGFNPGSEDVIVHRALTPVVWEREHLEILAAAVRRTGAPALPVHLKIDTGMSRLGVRPEALGEVADWLCGDDGRNLHLEGVMTHLACADELDDPVSEAQIDAFDACMVTLSRRGLRPDIRHVCNSAGLVRYPRAHYDMVRPGIALYGAASAPQVQLSGVTMAMSVHSQILAIRELPSGSAVSYGHKAVLSRDSRLGVVPVGYADGYARNMSGSAEVLIRGHRCPVIGNITMDLSMVDVTDLPDARTGERVTLMGSQGRDAISLYELASWSNQIPYEVLCGISKRVPRRL